ncbi:NAD(P)-binding domain-containing protein [Ramlibacter sp. AN1133]|uniref:NAD(P)-binding domain-containing protein n=1 Tax=Ramlibacter sp. AN1133 TaxID=3133429 RepID=UPI0030C0B24E
MHMENLFLYLAVIALAMTLYLRRQRRRHAADAAELAQAVQGGLAEPATLHPVVDPDRCMGGGSCNKACPEGVLGVVDGKMALKNAAACVGHGACVVACPTEAIRLVFGSEKRGVEIPHISPDFETNVAGIYIAGELGGMGLIRKACEQGRQAIAAIGRQRADTRVDYDVVIVGCGPAGLSAGLSALRHRLRYRIIEQEDSLGGTVYHYPRQKLVMTSPVELDIVGKMKFTEVRKESLLEFWNGVVEQSGLQISFRERMDAVERAGDHFVVRTSCGSHTARAVLLAIGRRGTPRKLEVPGEESPKVAYRLLDAQQYAGQRVLVVGGGDSALEAAIALSETSGTRVTLSYRGEAFSRVKLKNRMRLEQQQRSGRVQVVLGSRVERILANEVELVRDEQVLRVPNDAVIVCAGGLLPTPLLQKIGIRFDTKFGTA